MRFNYLDVTLKSAGLVVIALLLGAHSAMGQQQVNLTAGPSTATLPDGSTVPMWGYNCGAAVGGSLATCAAANPNAGSGWSPVMITVPTGQALTINLTNNLTFANGNTVPTSLTIVGQLGGGLGKPSLVAGPNHAALQTTWPVANTPNVTFT